MKPSQDHTILLEIIKALSAASVCAASVLVFIAYLLLIY